MLFKLKLKSQQISLTTGTFLVDKVSLLKLPFKLSHLVLHFLQVLLSAQDEGSSEHSMFLLEGGNLCLHPLCHPLHFGQLRSLLRLGNDPSLYVLYKPIPFK